MTPKRACRRKMVRSIDQIVSAVVAEGPNGDLAHWGYNGRCTNYFNATMIIFGGPDSLLWGCQSGRATKLDVDVDARGYPIPRFPWGTSAYLAFPCSRYPDEHAMLPADPLLHAV